MTDRMLRDAAGRMQAAVRREPVPDPPARHRRPFAAALAAAGVVTLVVGGWALFVRDGAAPGDAAGAGCPVTVPAAFTPPEPWPAAAPNGAWHGTPALWTELPADGPHWFDLPASPDGGLVQKTFWWSEAFAAAEEPQPALTVTARRLDGDAPVVAESEATNGSRSDTGAFMLSGIELPGAGCWEITGSYRGAALSYVVLVTA